ncbi:hypothetical protein HNR20_000601 [Micromonospora parathelypteridis]|uniref:Uncharacterized protein n=1 Tax=Micromonospora parathelypteridis TaxID=1839617 RepID=A0A840VJP3_9ACTN|nr:hypothetical protein [Micromonospora parathelypteridis]
MTSQHTLLRGTAIAVSRGCCRGWTAACGCCR